MAFLEEIKYTLLTYPTNVLVSNTIIGIGYLWIGDSFTEDEIEKRAETFASVLISIDSYWTAFIVNRISKIKNIEDALKLLDYENPVCRLLIESYQKEEIL